MFEKKKNAEIIYSYPAESEVAIFQVLKIVGEERYIGLLQEKILFNQLDELDKFLSHMRMNFEIFINKNFNIVQLKKNSYLTKFTEEIIGSSYFYFLFKTKEGYLLELPDELDSTNIYDFYEWIYNLVDSLKADIKKYNEKIQDRKAIINIVGASGSGKTTIGNFLKSKGIPELVSHTTRPMREGEKEGNPYYFITKEEFDKLEKVQQTVYADNYYCVSKKEVENKLKDNKYTYVITAIDGTKQIKDNCNTNVIVVYVKTDIDTMKKRMKERGDSESDIAKRIKYAIDTKELENEKYADIIIDNTKNLNEATEQLEDFLNI